MKRLHEIVSEIGKLKTKKEWEVIRHKAEMSEMSEEMDALERLQAIAVNADMDIEKVQVAEGILSCSGNLQGLADGKNLIECAVNDIANGCIHLKDMFFGNKRYDGFYQRSNHPYGYGPKHGYIVDRIEMQKEYRDKSLTDDQKDACIYYLKNWAKIKELTIN